MARLVRSVFVRDPDKHRDILLRAGEEPAPQYAALVRNPACWEDGKLPDTSTPDSSETSDTGDQNKDATTETKPAAPAAKKTAAKKTANAPARGRDAADEGSSGK